jgi:hypothetical protein
VQLDSARKLRWFDREDISGLVEVNYREKKALQATIAALRQVRMKVKMYDLISKSS